MAILKVADWSRFTALNIFNTFSNVSFTVTPEELEKQSSQILKEINYMKNHFSNMKSIVNKTSAYWIGEAGDVYRNNYKGKESDIEEMIKRLSEYVTDLNTIAKAYTKSEKEVEEISASLPADVIE